MLVYTACGLPPLMESLDREQLRTVLPRTDSVPSNVDGPLAASAAVPVKLSPLALGSRPPLLVVTTIGNMWCWGPGQAAPRQATLA